MKKIVLNRTIRNIIVILLICGTLIFSYGMYYAYSLPLQEQNVSVFNYKQKQMLIIVFFTSLIYLAIRQA